MKKHLLLVMLIGFAAITEVRAGLPQDCLDIPWGTPMESITGLKTQNCTDDYCSAAWIAAPENLMGTVIDEVSLNFIDERFFETEISARMELDENVEPSTASPNFKGLYQSCTDLCGDTAFEYHSGLATVKVYRWEHPELRIVLTATPSKNDIKLRILNKALREQLRKQQDNKASRIISDLKRLGTAAWNFINSGEPLKNPQGGPQR